MPFSKPHLPHFAAPAASTAHWFFFLLPEKCQLRQVCILWPVMYRSTNKSITNAIYKINSGQTTPSSFSIFKNLSYFPLEGISEFSQFWWDPHHSQSIGEALLRACTPEEKSVLQSPCKKKIKYKGKLFKLFTRRKVLLTRAKCPTLFITCYLNFVSISHRVQP